MFPIDPILYKQIQDQVAQEEPQIRKEARKTREFRQLFSRNYRTVGGYPSWDSICEAIAVELLALAIVSPALLQVDWVKNISLPNYYWSVYKKAKAWWLGRELADAFLHSEIRENVLDLKKITQFGLIILPKEFLYTPDGEEVLFISFSHWEKGEAAPPIDKPLLVEFKPCEFNQIILCTTTTEGTTYASSIGLRRTKNFILDRGVWHDNSLLSPDRKKQKEIESEFLSKLDNIVLQSLLVLQNYPEYVEAAPRVLKGVANTKKAGRPNEPSWIGRNFRYRRIPKAPLTDKQSKGNSGDRAPKIGFWRFLDSSKGWYKETRWVWNQPEKREDDLS